MYYGQKKNYREDFYHGNAQMQPSSICPYPPNIELDCFKIMHNPRLTTLRHFFALYRTIVKIRGYVRSNVALRRFLLRIICESGNMFFRCANFHPRLAQTTLCSCPNHASTEARKRQERDKGGKKEGTRDRKSETRTYVGMLCSSDWVGEE